MNAHAAPLPAPVPTLLAALWRRIREVIDPGPVAPFGLEQADIDLDLAHGRD